MFKRLCTGTLSARILSFTAVLLLVILTASMATSFFAAKRLSEDFVVQQTKTVADTYFDGLNKLMLTGGMAERGKLKEEINALPNVVGARVIRGPAVAQQYGPGMPDEAANGSNDAQVLNGEEVARFEHTDAGRVLVVSRPYRASENTRGVNCMG